MHPHRAGKLRQPRYQPGTEAVNGMVEGHQVYLRQGRDGPHGGLVAAHNVGIARNETDHLPAGPGVRGQQGLVRWQASVHQIIGRLGRGQTQPCQTVVDAGRVLRRYY